MARARVVLTDPLPLLDYLIPDDLDAHVQIGTPVKVPLGNRSSQGYVTERIEEPYDGELELKPITSIDEEKSPLPESLLQLILFGADYYCSAPGEMLSVALPSSARPSSYRYRITEAANSPFTGKLMPKDLELLEIARQHEKGFTVVAIEKSLGWTRRSSLTRLKKLREKGLLERLQQQSKKGRKIAAYRRVESGAKEELSARQNGAKELLENIPCEGHITGADLTKLDKSAYSRLKTLLSKGLIEKFEIEQKINPYTQIAEADTRPEPTQEQAAALNTLAKHIASQTFASFMLQGVTGSGKTEVYLRAIEQVLSLGKTALVLVPEIALTPQLGSRFRARFGEKVATFHSGLTQAERRDEWERVRNKEALIGLGARSALFLPLENIGIIVVDEEHETSFKQEEAPRYNARDLAVFRAHKENAVVVLGSATPSLETRTNADKGRYQSLMLHQRVHKRALPAVTIINLGEEERIGDGIFTQTMVTAIEETLAKNEQIILFQNRRGFAPYVSCRDCGHTFRCDSCDVSLTLHRRRGILQCHYCAFETQAQDECPSCGGHRVGSFGVGTERIEAELHRLFPEVKVQRLDRDEIRTRHDLEKALDLFRSGESQILVGTQMVTKGHDFPGVTLVGVICADASLNFPDFRAAERTFQLLTQVAGRAGRGEKEGRVLVQTFETDHYAITCAAEHDFEAFIKQELVYREELFYPPFAYLCLLRFESEDEQKAMKLAVEQAEKLRNAARKMDAELLILGPALAPLSRIKGIYRIQLLLKGGTRNDVRKVLGAISNRPQSGVRQILDVDPISML
jgi:primosomal protein N' (replication factor Y)